MDADGKSTSVERPPDSLDGQRADAPCEMRSKKAEGGPRSSAGDMNRRTFVAGVGGAAVLCALGAVRLAGEECLVRPPGGQDYDKLIGRCIRCGKCVEVCPQRAIVFTDIEQGVLTQRMPTMEFKAGYCDWCESQGERLCVKVCPTGALELDASAEAQDVILGIAEVDSTTCLAYRDIGCRYCFDACPYEAIEMDESGHPSVLADLCNGCGACEAACVSLQDASISSTASERAIKVRALDENGNLVGSFAERGAGA